MAVSVDSGAEELPWNSKDADFDNSHKVIGAFIDALQNCFKKDTHYDRPLMPPQSNIVFAQDKDLANKMTTYMCAKIQEIGFERHEFRFNCKSCTNGDVTQRLRLEFPDGVSLQMLWKITRATGMLEQYLNKYSPQ